LAELSLFLAQPFAASVVVPIVLDRRPDPKGLGRRKLRGFDLHDQFLCEFDQTLLEWRRDVHDAVKRREVSHQRPDEPLYQVLARKLAIHRTRSSLEW